MKQLSDCTFPETAAEAAVWQPEYRWHPLDRKIMVVAKTRIEGKWAAYIGVIPGDKHGDEWQSVAEEGTKLREEVARAIFPCFNNLAYAK